MPTLEVIHNIYIEREENETDEALLNRFVNDINSWIGTADSCDITILKEEEEKKLLLVKEKD